ncbi:MAG: hypothetical protein LBD82_01755 [Deltaproteobacteria bacterium]|jgi:type II secretory pathway pseudopilin PulG|nr:hypothetical protein [Deltaproteobacteria bacterium]
MKILFDMHIPDTEGKAMKAALFLLVLVAIAAGAAGYRLSIWRKGMERRIRELENRNMDLEKMLDRYKNDRLYYTHEIDHLHEELKHTEEKQKPGLQAHTLRPG